MRALENQIGTGQSGARQEQIDGIIDRERGHIQPLLAANPQRLTACHQHIDVRRDTNQTSHDLGRAREMLEIVKHQQQLPLGQRARQRLLEPTALRPVDLQHPRDLETISALSGIAGSATIHTPSR
jgi:hypothetical protein